MKAKTLAMIKMEKNFIAHIDKNYPRFPYEELPLEYLRKRLLQEVNELNDALKAEDIGGAKLECADVSNVVDYIFESLTQLENEVNKIANIVKKASTL
jgi:hypothetical protein